MDHNDIDPSALHILPPSFPPTYIFSITQMSFLNQINFPLIFPFSLSSSGIFYDRVSEESAS